MSSKGALHQNAEGLIAVALNTPEIIGRVEIRVSQSNDIHDRALVAQSGEVMLLGTSLPGIGKHFTSLIKLDEQAWRTFRKRYEDLWKAGSVIQPQPLTSP